MTTTTYTASEKARRAQPSPLVRLGVPVLVLVVLLGAGLIFLLDRGGGSGSYVQTFAAVRGPLTISVIESGTVRSRHQEVIKSEVEGQTTILYLIPEGTMVNEGDLLVQLDASRLEDQRIEAQIRVQNAEAAFIRARENLQVVRSQGESDVARAQLDHRFAVEDLANYISGNYPKELKEAQNRIIIAREEMQRATDKLNWSKILFDEKYISQTELQADELSARRAQLDLELAEANLALLQNFTHRRRLAELESNIEQTERALERVKLSRNADLVQAQADLRARDSEFERQRMQLSRVERQIERASIRAPRAGMVVYATSAQAGRGNVEPLAEGQTIRERQDLIFLPTATAASADIKIHEASLQKVKVGMPVQITVDALPGRVFTGRIARIAPLPDNQGWWGPDLKVYSTEIHIDGDGSDLRTGMSCRAEVIVERYDDAIFVPVQAVTRIGEQPVVFVQNGREIVRRPIDLGLDNNRMARIIDGLREGERVLLNPPLSDTVIAAAGQDDGTAAAGVGGGSVASADGTAAAAAATAPNSPAAENPARGERGERAERGERRGRGNQPADSASISDEQREEMRRRFESMTPEQREELRRRVSGAAEH